jgi:hypothetical protein
VGFYAAQVGCYISTFGRDRVHMIVFEEYDHRAVGLDSCSTSREAGRSVDRSAHRYMHLSLTLGGP